MRAGASPTRHRCCTDLALHPPIIRAGSEQRPVRFIDHGSTKSSTAFIRAFSDKFQKCSFFSGAFLDKSETL